MIAMALCTNPELLIADEPTTALDVTIQAQILELMKSLRERNRMAIMLITHDLGVIAEMADDVVVMYAGKVVEQSDALTVFEQPHHPYTKGPARLDPAAGRAARAPGGHPGRRAEPAQPARPAASSSGAARTRCRSATRRRRSRRSQPGQLSRCWLTPAGEPPAVGPDATGEVAEEAAAALTVSA